MNAIDTNVLVRLLTEDNPVQLAATARLFSESQVWVSKTVLLETNWVLRSVYSYTPQQVHNSIVSIVALPNVEVEDAAEVESALAWSGSGMQFADALHLASRPATAPFFTFDTKLAAQASRLDVPNVHLAQ